MTKIVNGTTLTLTGTYSGGYAIKSAYNHFYLTMTGKITGTGLRASTAMTVDNYGTIAAAGSSMGVELTAGGYVGNSGSISGYSIAVEVTGKSGTVANLGNIRSTNSSDFGSAIAIYLGDGGAVDNFGRIYGGYGSDGVGVQTNGAYAVVYNSINGTISASEAIVVGTGGYVLNEGTLDANRAGISINTGRVLNDGSISSEGYGIASQGGYILNNAGASIAAGQAAIYGFGFTIKNLGTIISYGRYGVESGARITNGSSKNTSALIEGYEGGVYSSEPVLITNYGTINVYGDSVAGVGVQIQGGSVINGTKLDTTALISGHSTGVVADGTNALVENFGTIETPSLLVGSTGVYLGGTSGDLLINGSVADNKALIVGADSGIMLKGAGSVTNFGTVTGGYYGVTLKAGGHVTNGSAQDTVATIDGYSVGIRALGTAAQTTTVNNFGTIRSPGYSVELFAGGALVNGNGSDTAALIVGSGDAADFLSLGTSAGTVTNYGSLVGITRFGVLMAAGGKVTNGSALSRAATIEGYYAGIYMGNANGTVTNFGDIRDNGNGRTSYGVTLSGTGTVTNGSGIDTTALIEGGTAVEFGGSGTVKNFGTMIGATGPGVALKGGAVVNGAATDTTALLEGYDVGVLGIAGGGAVALVNYASLVSAGSYYGVYFQAGGHVTNGSVHDSSALIDGGGGVAISGVSGTVANFGMIEANDPGAGFTAVALHKGGNVTNGTAGKNYGLIVGSIGIDLLAGGTVTNYGTVEGDGAAAILVSGAGTVTNFGTLDGVGGTALSFGAASDLLVAEAGSVFEGVVNGGGGTLEVLGAGTLSGLLANGNVTVSVSLPTPTAFTDFHTVDVGSGGSFTVAGNAAIATGETLIVAGTLSMGGTLAVTGSLASSGTIAGTGTLVLGGIASFASGTALTIAHVSVTAGTVTPGFSLPYAGTFVQSGGTIAIAHGLNLSGSVTFSGGTVNGVGYLQTSGATTLSSLALNGGAVWQESGALTQTGTLTLGDSSGGSGRLVVETGAAFDITTNGGIAIASGGTASIANVALFEKTAGTGLSTIGPAISNTGTILATAGTLDFAGVVSGAGQATIGSAGTLEFAGAVAATQTVTFAGTTGGDLILDDPSGSGLSFAGTVSGFSGSDKLDLPTFAFSGTPVIGWSQTSASAGTLTLTDGTEVAKITLFGQYSQSGFGKGHDAGTGTVITYTPPPQIALAAPHH